jgi:hypothetical protein
MSTIGMPSLAMLLVLANFALCLSVDRQKFTSDLRRPANMALPLGAPRNVMARHRPDGAALAVTTSPRAD